VYSFPRRIKKTNALEITESFSHWFLTLLSTRRKHVNLFLDRSSKLLGYVRLKKVEELNVGMLNICSGILTKMRGKIII
jgi:hypothetical protein